MKRAMWAVVAVTVVGCGTAEESPADRLARGQFAMLTNPTDESVYLETADERGKLLALGTRVQCETDDQKPKMVAPAGKNFPQDTRPVTVLVLEGPHKGVIGVVQRCHIRPVAE